MASDALVDGRARCLLAGGAEEHSAIVQAALPRPPLEVVPGLSSELGEAACIFVLETADAAAQRQVAPHLTILGWASGHLPMRSLDARQTALDRASGVLRQALEAAGVEPGQLALASVSALDPLAASLERSMLDAVCGSSLPRISVKARCGECLGASGALQVLPAFALSRRGPNGGQPLLLAGEREPRILDSGPVVITAIDPHGPIAVLVVAP
jgi:hypothetical protein